ncbi:MAG: EAL domain-containing protein, partial [Methyloprofundus sp.]|nr:EAL domain-containing protein [Methyloprofundus sp.]
DVTGYSAAEVLGKNSRVLSSGRHDKAFFVNMFTSLAEKGKWEGEVWNRLKSGESYPERISITAVYDGDEITHYVGIFSDISEKKATEEEIRRLAFYDSLTGLPNRRLLLDRLEQAIISAKRHNDFGAVIYMDLDRFKSLNDTLGHQVGDELLVQVAQRIEAVIRAEDTACRLGGDEFVVLVSRTDTELNEVIEQAAFIAEKIRKEINRPFELSGSMQSFSTSIGVSVFPDQVDLAEEILEQADTAMYRSKQTGRNRVSFFSAQMQSEHNRKSSLERMLHAALDELQFVIYYQGQTNSAGEILSAEALLRWIHPEQGMVSPAEFIPVAEESHLIVEIGSWVLCEVCRQIKAWQDVGFYLDHVAVNISPRQFRQDDFVRQVEAAIAGSGIEAKYLMIEITEGIVIEDIQATIDKMLQIQAMGIAISIDDFGTGYSSLAYLKKLPLSQLKIDQSFVRDINIDTSDEVIVEAIIALAHKLDLEVIAEGVETKEQLHFLHEKGCDKYQGYYFYRPVSAEELFLKSERRTHNIS